jgi:branched-chain amino acid transport system permease protein
MDRRVAASVGVSPWRYKTFAFVLAGTLAGVAGSLIAPLMHSPPNPAVSFSTFNSLFILAIAVVAGFASLLGIVTVAVAFTLIPMALESFHISTWIFGGVALGWSTALGRAGISGVISARLRAGSLREAQASAARPPVGPARRRPLSILEDWLRPPLGEQETLTLEGVSVSFGGLRALSDVSITVRSGEWVGLIGPNGAGKSTLFDVASGLLRPESGAVTLFGTDVTGRPPWERAASGMARTFQSLRVDPHQPVRDNLLAGAYTTAGGSLFGILAGRPDSWAGMRRAEEAARAVAELLAIDRYWDEYPSSLSFGNRRRVELGRTLMTAPRLILLDEPTAGLDPGASELLLTLLKELQADLALTVVLVEHHVPAVLAHSDRVYVLDQGRVLAQGTPAEIVDDPEVRSRYLGAAFRLRRTAGAT